MPVTTGLEFPSPGIGYFVLWCHKKADKLDKTSMWIKDTYTGSRRIGTSVSNCIISGWWEVMPHHTSHFHYGLSSWLTVQGCIIFYGERELLVGEAEGNQLLQSMSGNRGPQILPVRDLTHENLTPKTKMLPKKNVFSIQKSSGVAFYKG